MLLLEGYYKGVLRVFVCIKVMAAVFWNRQIYFIYLEYVKINLSKVKFMREKQVSPGPWNSSNVLIELLWLKTQHIKTHFEACLKDSEDAGANKQ